MTDAVGNKDSWWPDLTLQEYVPEITEYIPSIISAPIQTTTNLIPELGVRNIIGSYFTPEEEVSDVQETFVTTLAFFSFSSVQKKKVQKKKNCLVSWICVTTERKTLLQNAFQLGQQFQNFFMLTFYRLLPEKCVWQKNFFLEMLHSYFLDRLVYIKQT